MIDLNKLVQGVKKQQNNEKEGETSGVDLDKLTQGIRISRRLKEKIPEVQKEIAEETAPNIGGFLGSAVDQLFVPDKTLEERAKEGKMGPVEGFGHDIIAALKHAKNQTPELLESVGQGFKYAGASNITNPGTPAISAATMEAAFPELRELKKEAQSEVAKDINVTQATLGYAGEEFKKKAGERAATMAEVAQMTEQNVPGVLAGLLASRAGLGPVAASAVGIGAMTPAIYGQEISRLVSEGADPDKVIGLATVHTLVESASEAVPMPKIIETLVKHGKWTEFLKAYGLNVGQDFGAELAHGIIDMYTHNPNMTFSQALENAIEEGKISALGTPVIMGMGKAAEVGMGAYDRWKAATTIDKEVIQDLIKEIEGIQKERGEIKERIKDRAKNLDTETLKHLNTATYGLGTDIQNIDDFIQSHRGVQG
ncbi:MAG: hypothetical protein D6698_12030, partial [Gammaproteobacteria bacterium]